MIYRQANKLFKIIESFRGFDFLCISDRNTILIKLQSTMLIFSTHHRETLSAAPFVALSEILQDYLHSIHDIYASL